MHAIKLTDELIQRAKDTMLVYNPKTSWRKGGGGYVARIGELIYLEYFGGELLNDYDYDVAASGGTIDVKTKECNGIPRPEYNATIYASNTTQQCTGYYFIRVDVNNRVAYLCGWKNKKDFFNEATFCKKGEKDSNGYEYPADCYNLQIKYLK